MKKLYLHDAILILSLIILALAAYFLPLARPDGGEYVKVYLDGELMRTLSLDKGADTEYTPDGGKTRITVKDGKAYVSGSDCPDKLCMHMKPLGKDDSGSVIVCLPNRVTLVPSSNGGKLDTVAG